MGFSFRGGFLMSETVEVAALHRKVSFLTALQEEYDGDMTLGHLLEGLSEELEERADGPLEGKQKYPVKPEYRYRDWWTEDEPDLRGEDPECQHELVSGHGGGVACRRCPGWFCF